MNWIKAKREDIDPGIEGPLLVMARRHDTTKYFPAIGQYLKRKRKKDGGYWEISLEGLAYDSYGIFVSHYCKIEGVENVK